MNRMMNFTRSKLLFRRIQLFSTTLVTHCESKAIVSAELQSKILFSSYLESLKPKLGYKQNRAREAALLKNQQRERLQRINIKPFPQVLKSLVSNLDVESDLKDEESQHTEIRYVKSKSKYPEDWMSDYEFYDSDDESGNRKKSGTADPSIPPSKIPCSGCGAVLHCADVSLPGYIPSEIFRGRTNKELQMIICQRCHFLKHYNIALDVAVSPEDYIRTLKAVEDKYALAILIVDLLDFPCSIWPGIQDILGSKRPVFIVGNKVDLLPKDSPGYLNRIRDCLHKAVINSGIDRMNIKHIALISAKTGYGIEELITNLHNIWKYNGDVYLIGCTNVGKSTLFNSLLASDYCKSQAVNLIQKATTCPWPGTTLQMLKFPILRPSDVRVYHRHKRLFSERAQKYAEETLRKEQMKATGNPNHATLMGHIGRTFIDDAESSDPFSMSRGSDPILTLNERDKDYINSKWCYDTPGVVHPDQITHLLTTEEILEVTPDKIIQPQSFIMKPGMSLFLSGLARLCVLEGPIRYIRIHVFSASQLPLLIAYSEYADEIYRLLRGTDLLPIPQKDEERKREWPGLEPSAPITVTGEVESGSTCDIVLSSIGWVSIELPIGTSCKLLAWTPQMRGIHVRNPALISQTKNLRGTRVRGSLAYKRKICKL